MNSLEKYRQEEENREYWEKKQHQAYYLHKQLKAKSIKYNAREKAVYPKPTETEDKHVQALLTDHNYNIQTIIE